MAYDIAGAQTSPLQAFMMTKQGFAEGKQRGEQSRLARLVSQGMSSPGGLRAITSEVASFNPDAAFELEDRANSQMEQRRKLLSDRARLLSAMPVQQRAQAWPSMRAELAQLDPELGTLPEQYDDAQFGPVIQQLAGIGGEGPRVHSSRVGEDGFIYNIMADGQAVNTGVKADRQAWFANNPGVDPYIARKDGSIQIVGPGTQPQPPQQTPPAGNTGSPQMDAIMRQANAIIAAGGTQEQVDAWIQMAAQNAPGVQVGPPQAAPPPSQPPVQPGIGNPPNPLRRPAPAPAGSQPPSGYRFAADGQTLEPIPGGPADRPAQDKPIPVGALKLLLDATESLSVAEGVDELLAGFERQIESGTLDIGPMKNAISQARNFANQSNPQSTAYASFRAGLEKLRNDSLRLNKGVQTDGDAQRAWNELMDNINDEGVVKARLKEIREINARGVRLQQEKLRQIESNYQGKAAADSPEDDIDALLAEFGQ